MSVPSMTRRAHRSKLLAACLLSLPVFATSSFGQGVVTLIGPSLQNGSFEDGVLSPWTPDGNDTVIVRDPLFASEGQWYALVSVIARGSIVRAGTGQWLDADRNDGLFFSLTVDAQNGGAAFEGLRVSVGALNSDESNVATSTALFNLPSLGWQKIHAEFEIPDSWDGGGNVFLGFQFEGGNAAVGTPYTGYLDNVVLTQIPEPTPLTLLGLGGLCLWLLAFQRRAAGSGRIELNRRRR